MAINRENKSGKAEQAVELMLQGAMCSEAVLLPYAEEFGLKRDIAAKIGGGFAGGMAQGKTCGAVTGAVMVLGLKYGAGLSKEQFSRDKCFQLTQEFFFRFTERRKTGECAEILKMNGVNIMNPEDMEGLKDKGLCDKIVRDAVEILEEIFVDESL